MGQVVPGTTPTKFAPGVISTDDRDFSGFFSPDMAEFYFTRRYNETPKWFLIGYTQENGQWRKTSETPRIGRPVFSPDGKTMHLGRRYKTRTDQGWSDLKDLGAPYDKILIMRLMSSSKGTFVLDEATREGDGKLRYSRMVNGKRQDPVPFGPDINAGKWNAHPFIAPDESYMIWDGEREKGLGDNDLLISFRLKNGGWGEAINKGKEVNTEAADMGAIVTPDGKYLFFNRYRKDGKGDIYWVDSQVIEDLRPE
ncbi:hypothetical protein QGN29_09545 [Temperatibacter marinus]|uniref:Uncharacterized protein n=1 Tax=Temperatibacter marinus TaxID=1456591 RepID=A0AA52EFB8_9PROT|nr:hypothetical protein [Temperatibacter marinus]WND01795.1 hypothetical protein QGN29_09545 [Temperatibacter marinus]